MNIYWNYLTKNRYMEEAIKGLNKEKEILTVALAQTKSFEKEIKLRERLREIGEHIVKILSLNK